MSFEEKLREFIERVKKTKDNIATEEATKTSIVMPFFQILGYDVFNPTEFIPEYTADVGIKKGEKVDYAILLNGELTLLIEAKSINEQLEKHDSQLFRYFGTTAAKFAILTNGLVYRFYSDLDEQNKMDSSPFFEINLLDISDSEIIELKKFCKDNFDLSMILDTASELKYLGLIKKVLKDEFANPSDDFIRFILSQGVYDGMKTQNTVEKYRPTVKKSISQYINELVNDKIQNALKSDESFEPKTVQQFEEVDESSQISSVSNIITTDEEIECFFIIKSILHNAVDLNRIGYKDTASYFSVIIDGKVTKWICRIFLKENTKYIIIPNCDSNEKIMIENLDDIYTYSDQLVARLNNLVG
ncbi:type I restriction enzyme HsdR N-terminal domain-containing protein [Acetobacterium wieringae]|uniref:Type I restriction enzyme HsdR N-terminal domain-containing protein n=1 Tax=Acetobacterium wieringae TaxID=52694 RepID=A0ABY6HBX9_9FIRM|nr:type I restriction endonuclease [Acetobacterium wieringae]UYO61862.1 type I restriction enzyme HsdR N-terminal domain-containing protein [Acetobacterium wieringae]